MKRSILLFYFILVTALSAQYDVFDFAEEAETYGAIAQRRSAIPAMTEGEWFTLFEDEGPGMITHIWFTFPRKDVMLGRKNLLKMTWDNEENPSVIAPLGDFFGLPFGYTGNEYKVNSEYIVTTPENGLNCYFKMPYAKNAKIEILPDQLQSGGGFYIQVDYYKYKKELPEKYRDLRFHSAFRFENPTERYGRNYIFADATGKGVFVGATFGIKMNYPQTDEWYHGGGDSFYIDGETSPVLLHGIGAEDFFGHAWGVGKEEIQTPSIGNPLKEFDKYGVMQKLVLYRFFVHDPIPFESSIHAKIGAMGNDYSSVAYWYQEEPHTPFFEIPASEDRLPESEAPYGTYDITGNNELTWKLLAPFRINEEYPFEKTRDFEVEETGDEEFLYEGGGRPTLPDGNNIDVKWIERKSTHNFVDFIEVARPAILYIALPGHVYGYALTYIESDEDKDVNIHFGFDDEAIIRVNEKEIYHGKHDKGFAPEIIQAKLKKGKNRILVKLSNYDNINWRSWAFSFRVEE